MQTKPPSSFCAAAAIAAALALGSTAVSAQEVVPTIAPPPPTSAAPAAAAPATAISAPVVQAVPPAAAEPDPAPRAEARAARAAPGAGRQAARSVAAAAPASATPAPAAAAPVAAAPVAGAPIAASPISAPRPVPLAPAPVATQSPANGPTGAEAGLIALLAAGGLAGAGFMLRRSRRKHGDQEGHIDPADAGQPPFVTTPAMQVAAPPVVSEPQPVCFAMPVGPLPTGEEREALLQRMVDAAPDAANPFTSRKARRKRASLILQHRDHLQCNPAAQPFDWRTYPRPSTAEAAAEERVPHPA